MGVPKPLDEIIIATPQDIVPSSKEMRVIGCTNPGGVRFTEGGKEYTSLMARIIEKPNIEWRGHIGSPYAIQGRDYRIKIMWERESRDVTINDSNSLITLELEERVRPLTISHLRLMESQDGIEFKISEKPTFFPQMPYEVFGVEDARITEFEQPIKFENELYRFLMTYVACSEDYGVCTAFAATNDCRSYVRLPKGSPDIVFFSTSKDVVLFPRKFPNPRTGEMEYLALTRPMGAAYMVPSMFLSYSKDLIQWGDHKLLVRGDERGHVGAGPPPIEVEDGWLIIYHQHRHLLDRSKEYIGTEILVDKHNPLKILKKSREFLEPHLEIPVQSIVPKVTFPSAAALHGDNIFIYSGEEDAAIALHIYRLQDLMDFLEPV